MFETTKWLPLRCNLLCTPRTLNLMIHWLFWVKCHPTPSQSSVIRRFRKKPEVAWKRGLRTLRSSRHLAVNIKWINNRSRKSFKMEQVNIEDIKLTPEDIPGASFKDSEICKLTVNQLKFWLKCRRVNQGGNKKVLYERYMLTFKVKFILT